ncbi:MAG: SMP-30/gluconolactonase/LRE family protein [Bacteroidetes bacterium]|nr:SMP-30/gluconolactonase/LRE family protein [Bacteroidota bacterium]MDA1119785.1 SMP-30/gluconolactonase/LRE family protein [Bacteroidota bacterium]
MNSKQKNIGLGISIGIAVIFFISFESYAQDGTYPTDVLRLDPQMDNVVSPNAKVELISDGFNWTEGPLWVPEGQFLLFCDVPENKIFKWKEGEGTSIYLQPSGYTGSIPRKSGGAGGLLLDNEGRLLLTQQGDRQLGRMNSSVLNPKPNYTAVVDEMGGFKFNSPNDLTIDKKGNVYFTDPPYGLDLQDNDPTKELDYSGVYRLSIQGQLSIISKKLKRPNGIGLSPNGKTLYVANSDPDDPKLMAYDLNDNGEVIKERLLFDATKLLANAKVRQNPDGLDVARNGNIFATGPDGVLVLTPSGKHLGTIRTIMMPSNCDLNEDESVLYVTSDAHILKVTL